MKIWTSRRVFDVSGDRRSSEYPDFEQLVLQGPLRVGGQSTEARGSRVPIGHCLQVEEHGLHALSLQHRRVDHEEGEVDLGVVGCLRPCPHLLEIVRR